MAELRYPDLDFSLLVEKNADSPCCSSCRNEQDAGVVPEYSDWCCCVHGEVFGRKWPDRIKWEGHGAEERYRALTEKGSRDG